MTISKSQLKRGKLIMTQTRNVINFMFNPTTLMWRHGWEWSRKKVAGRSHQFVGGGAGMDEVYQFQLWLDGDRGRLERRQAGFEEPISVEDEINDLMSLTLPYTSEFDDSYGNPESFIMDWGSTIPDIECVVDGDVTVNKLLFTRGGDCYRATVDMSVIVIEGYNVPAWKRVVDRPTRMQPTPAGQALVEANAGAPLLPTDIRGPKMR